MKKYVLIGGSIATEGAIEGILSVDKNADITVICGEKRPLYSRPLISYVLEKKTPDEGLYFRGKEYYEKNKERIKQYRKEYRQKHPQMQYEANKRWAEKNRDHKNELQKAYYQRKKESAHA